jgi:cytoskeleton protein RodZ
MRPDEYPDQPDKMTDLSVDQKLANVTNLRPTVGDELRMRREEAGHTINDVSEAVRIQPRYLEALEKGRLEDLPGTVYALGFLRTYAEHYGFNGGAFVTRFKEETEGLRREQDFSLPEPIEDARVPTAAIFIVAIVLHRAGHWCLCGLVQPGSPGCQDCRRRAECTGKSFDGPGAISDGCRSR